jgi:RNA polymerase sigma-70 factor (ECF subfamily)
MNNLELDQWMHTRRDQLSDSLADRVNFSERRDQVFLAVAESQVQNQAAQRRYSTELAHHGALGWLDVEYQKAAGDPVIVKVGPKKILATSAAAIENLTTFGDTLVRERPKITRRPRRVPEVTETDTAEIFAKLKSAAFHELVRSSVAGDQEAIATLFVWIQPAIVRYCRSRIGRSGSAYSSADDVAQEICMTVHRILSRYSDEPTAFLPSVYGIAAHKVADHYRKTSRDRSSPAADVPDCVDVEANPEQQIMAADLRERLNVLLSTLPSRQQEILRLRLIVGLSAQETAAVVGLTPTAVRVTQHRALATLRGTLTAAEWI